MTPDMRAICPRCHARHSPDALVSPGSRCLCEECAADIDDEEQVELERLRAEVERLRSEIEAAPCLAARPGETTRECDIAGAVGGCRICAWRRDALRGEGGES